MTATETTRTHVVQADHEKMVNNEVRTFTEADFPVGAVAHQGDVIIVRIASLPDSTKIRANRQLADGDTRGARHILAGNTKAYDCEPAELVKLVKAVCPKSKLTAEYTGIAFETPAYLEHPDHGDHEYAFEGVCAVVIQRNVDADEKARKARD